MRKLLPLLLCALPAFLQAREVKDTIFTESKDRIIITYDVKNTDGKSVVSFLQMQKKLSTANQSQYKDLDKVAVMFFDRVAGTDIKIENMTPQAFIVPAGCTYEASDEGYFILQDNPSITFRTKGKEKMTLRLPIYLAYHEKKGRYKLFAKSNELEIKLNAAAPTAKATSNANAAALSPNPKIRKKQEEHAFNADDLFEEETLTVEEDLGQNEQQLKVLGLRRDIMAMLDMQAEEGELGPTEMEELGYLVQDLRKLKYEVQDEEVLLMIEETLDAYRKAQKGKEANAAASAAAQQAAAQAEAKAAAAAAKAEQDSIAAVQEQKDAESKKQTMWMIIGGVALAVLGFVGNMIFKNIQQKKQQLSMENMTKRMQMEAQKKAAAATQEAMKKAEEASRQAAMNAMNHAQQTASQPEQTPGAAQPVVASQPAPTVQPAPAQAEVAAQAPVQPTVAPKPNSAQEAAAVATAGISPNRPARRKLSDVKAGVAAPGSGTIVTGGSAPVAPQPGRTIGNYKVAPRRPRPGSEQK
ncbi:MAG: hypothetical protein KBT12_08470 [Bacteroidales bacterium]|nr:hypothetical protein [Candidatus Physcousia equi]